MILCGESLLFFDRNCGVSFNQVCHHPTGGFDTEGQWGYVNKDQVSSRATLLGQNSSLDSSTISYGLIRVDVGVVPAASGTCRACSSTPTLTTRRPAGTGEGLKTVID